MNQFIKHIPSFVDAEAPTPVEFKTTENLLAIDYVDSWKRSEGFSHYAKSEDCIMAILNGGRNWWVVGYVQDSDSVDLPEWVRPGSIPLS